MIWPERTFSITLQTVSLTIFKIFLGCDSLISYFGEILNWSKLKSYQINFCPKPEREPWRLFELKKRIKQMTDNTLFLLRRSANRRRCRIGERERKNARGEGTQGRRGASYERTATEIMWKDRSFAQKGGKIGKHNFSILSLQGVRLSELNAWSPHHFLATEDKSNFKFHRRQ